MKQRKFLQVCFLLGCILFLFGRDSQQVFSQVLNNGGRYIQQGEAVYYREYEAKDVEEGALHGNYREKAESEKNLVRLSPDGTKEILFTDFGIGNLFLFQEEFFLQGEDMTGNPYIYSIDMEGKNKKMLSYGTIETIDEENQILICSRNTSLTETELFRIDLNTKEQKLLTFYAERVAFLAQKDGIVYFTKNKDEIAMLYCVPINENENATLLVEYPITNLDETFNPIFFNSYGVQNIDFVGDEIIFTLGVFEGSANLYSGGILAKVKKDGSQFTILANSEEKWVEEAFYILRKGGEVFVCFRDGRRDSYSISLKTGIKQKLDFEVYAARMPFHDDTSSIEMPFFFDLNPISVYLDDTGEKTTLIEISDYKEHLPEETEQNKEDFYFDYNKNVEWIGNWVYYTLESKLHDASHDSGWRYYYIREKTWCYRKNRVTGEKQLLYSY